MPRWWNGIHASLKNWWGQLREGSTPSLGTTIMERCPIFKWSPNLAYAVGLITTDGCLSKDKRHIELTSHDLQLIETFKKCLSLENRIGKKYGSFTDKNSYRVQFSNVNFYRWLTRIGLSANKTSRLKRIRVPRKYFKDFLRGHLDGDGSIINYIDRRAFYKGKRYRYQRIYLTFYSSSLKYLEWIQKEITIFLRRKGSLQGRKRQSHKRILWRLRFAKNDSLKLLSWLYYKPALPCLIRKKKIAEYFLRGFKTA